MRDGLGIGDDKDTLVKVADGRRGRVGLPPVGGPRDVTRDGTEAVTESPSLLIS